MSINVGSLVATFLTPIFRGDIKCFGGDCYPLAFGVPAAFLLSAIIIFIAGSKHYKIEGAKKGPNVIIETFRVIFYSLREKIRGDEPKEHWLDHAESKYGSEMVKNVKAFFKVGLVFLPLPIL